jgi:hypothetical protein
MNMGAIATIVSEQMKIEDEKLIKDVFVFCEPEYKGDDQLLEDLKDLYYEEKEKE